MTETTPAPELANTEVAVDNRPRFQDYTPDFMDELQGFDYEGISDPVADTELLAELSHKDLASTQDYGSLLGVVDRASREQKFYGAANLEEIGQGVTKLLDFAEANHLTDNEQLEDTVLRYTGLFKEKIQAEYDQDGDEEKYRASYQEIIKSLDARADYLRYERELPERQELYRNGPSEEDIYNSYITQAREEFKVLLQDPKLGRYDVIIGDDTSGRLVANFLYRASARLAASDPSTYKKPHLVYVAGGRGLKNRAEAIANYLDKQLPDDNGKKPTVLLATENIETGDSEEALLDIIKPRSADVSTSALSIMSRDLEQLDDRLGEEDVEYDEVERQEDAILEATRLTMAAKLGRFIGTINSTGAASGVRLHGSQHLTEKKSSHTSATANVVDRKRLSLYELRTALADRAAVDQLLDELMPEVYGPAFAQESQQLPNAA